MFDPSLPCFRISSLFFFAYESRNRLFLPFGNNLSHILRPVLYPTGLVSVRLKSKYSFSLFSQIMYSRVLISLSAHSILSNLQTDSWGPNLYCMWKENNFPCLPASAPACMSHNDPYFFPQIAWYRLPKVCWTVTVVTFLCRTDTWQFVLQLVSPK